MLVLCLNRTVAAPRWSVANDHDGFAEELEALGPRLAGWLWQLMPSVTLHQAFGKLKCLGKLFA